MSSIVSRYAYSDVFLLLEYCKKQVFTSKSILLNLSIILMRNITRSTYQYINMYLSYAQLFIYKLSMMMHNAFMHETH